MNIADFLSSFNGTGVPDLVGRHAIRRVEVLQPIVERLLATDQEAASALLHLTWWAEHGDMGRAWREKIIGELNVKIARLENQ